MREISQHFNPNSDKLTEVRSQFVALCKNKSNFEKSRGIRLIFLNYKKI